MINTYQSMVLNRFTSDMKLFVDDYEEFERMEEERQALEELEGTGLVDEWVYPEDDL